MLTERVRKAKRVYIVGNGGSYANASHIANDLLSCGVKAFTMDSAILTAFANDYGWFNAFERWINIVGEKGDLLIALSGSGSSQNILKAVEAAHSKGMDVWREYGYPQGLDMQAAEEHQLWMGHEVMRALK